MADDESYISHSGRRTLPTQASVPQICPSARVCERERTDLLVCVCLKGIGSPPKAGKERNSDTVNALLQTDDCSPQAACKRTRTSEAR